MEGLSSDKIALQMGMSDGNVRVKISRLKDKLQEIVKKYEY
jgi:DNA-directed RNA polymerase specialized sigma24 family protein